MPPEAPLVMPQQNLSYESPRRMRGHPTAAVLFARCILLSVSVGVTVYGVYQMLQVVRFASMTLLQGLMIFFFAVSLGWIAFAAGSVIAGASRRRDDFPDPAAGAGNTLTALVMPIYNEDPIRTTSALQAMAEALGRIEANRAFEIVVLSDSTNADAWIRETVAVDLLRRSLTAIMPVWYRRRWRNIARKAGNVEEFVMRWGGRYDHMIVLDADSLIDAPTLLRLVQMMQADPHLGILQTAPRLIGLRRSSAGCSNSPRASTARSSRGAGGLVRRQRQLLGPQRHHSRRGICGELRPARARGPQAVRRSRTLA